MAPQRRDVLSSGRWEVLSYYDQRPRDMYGAVMDESELKKHLRAIPTTEEPPTARKKTAKRKRVIEQDEIETLNEKLRKREAKLQWDPDSDDPVVNRIVERWHRENRVEERSKQIAIHPGLDDFNTHDTEGRFDFKAFTKATRLDLEASIINVRHLVSLWRTLYRITQHRESNWLGPSTSPKTLPMILEVPAESFELIYEVDIPPFDLEAAGRLKQALMDQYHLTDIVLTDKEWIKVHDALFLKIEIDAEWTDEDEALYQKIGVYNDKRRADRSDDTTTGSPAKG